MAAEIKSVKRLLEIENLDIPNYQRPYKWDSRNVVELLEDISVAIDEERKYPNDYRYRVGTILLYENTEKRILEIVDGQQRIITMTLINIALDPNFESGIIEAQFTDPISKSNIHSNYGFIR